jgi:hypothetical protein
MDVIMWDMLTNFGVTAVLLAEGNIKSAGKYIGRLWPGFIYLDIRAVDRLLRVSSLW